MNYKDHVTHYKGVPLKEMTHHELCGVISELSLAMHHLQGDIHKRQMEKFKMGVDKPE